MKKFSKLNDKQKQVLKQHKEKYGLKHSRIMRASMMRGVSAEEAHKKALAKSSSS